MKKKDIWIGNLPLSFSNKHGRIIQEQKISMKRIQKKIFYDEDKHKIIKN